jgi:hypothetical protein
MATHQGKVPAVGIEVQIEEDLGRFQHREALGEVGPGVDFGNQFRQKSFPTNFLSYLHRLQSCFLRSEGTTTTLETRQE